MLVASHTHIHTLWYDTTHERIRISRQYDKDHSHTNINTYTNIHGTYLPKEAIYSMYELEICIGYTAFNKIVNLVGHASSHRHSHFEDRITYKNNFTLSFSEKLFRSICSRRLLILWRPEWIDLTTYRSIEASNTKLRFSYYSHISRKYTQTHPLPHDRKLFTTICT